MYIEPMLQLAFMALLTEADNINLTTTWDKAQAQIEEDPRFLALHYRERQYLFNRFKR